MVAKGDAPGWMGVHVVEQLDLESQGQPVGEFGQGALINCRGRRRAGAEFAHRRELTRNLLLATVQFLKLLFGPRVLRIQLQNCLVIRFGFLSFLVGYMRHR